MDNATQVGITGNAQCPDCDENSQDTCATCASLGLVQVQKPIEESWGIRINACMAQVTVRDNICTAEHRAKVGYPPNYTPHYIASVSAQEADLAPFGIDYVGNQGRSEAEARAAVADDLRTIAMKLIARNPATEPAPPHG